MDFPHPLNVCLRFRQTATAIPGDTENVRVSGNCTFSGEPFALTVPIKGLIAWAKGTYSQNAFPDMSTDEREFLQSGTAPGLWDARMDEMECDR